MLVVDSDITDPMYQYRVLKVHIQKLWTARSHEVADQKINTNK